MSIRYPVAAPDLSGNELRYAEECIKSSWVSSQGTFLKRFEEQVAAAAGTPYAVAVCNGTAALHLALAALDLGPGDEVIVPSLTFIATANAVTYCGATPVFADCDPETWCIAPESIERLISPRTKGIIPVHLYGHPCDMDPILALARDRRLWVVEDAAEAMGAMYKGKLVGSLGDMGTFSFFGNKIITTGEGGAVVTQCERLNARLNLLRGQGMDPQKRYWHNVVGFNYRMTNLAAALGVAQMERFTTLVEQRRRLARWYDSALSGVEGLTLPVEAQGSQSAYWMYSLLTADEASRDALRSGLLDTGIETRPFFYPINEMPMYAAAPSDRGCPVTRDVSYRGLSLPSSSYLQYSDVELISAGLRTRLKPSLSRLRKAG